MKYSTSLRKKPTLASTRRKWRISYPKESITNDLCSPTPLLHSHLIIWYLAMNRNVWPKNWKQTKTIWGKSWVRYRRQHKHGLYTHGEKTVDGTRNKRIVSCEQMTRMRRREPGSPKWKRFCKKRGSRAKIFRNVTLLKKKLVGHQGFQEKTKLRTGKKTKKYIENKYRNTEQKLNSKKENSWINVIHSGLKKHRLFDYSLI